MKNILITGGAGYIGAHVAEKLIQKKKKIFIVDNLSTGFKKLFVKNEEEVDPDQVDEIEYADKKRGFVNIRIVGDADDYKITLGKDKNR